MTLPNFLYIGPPKSASTWLFEVLRTHPQVFVPDGKDVYFFDRYFDRGQGWYEAHFEQANARHIAIGEISHDYLYSRDAALRIRAMLPGVKLLTILRNPFDRSRSDFRYINQWSANDFTFAEALVRHPTIIDNSLYAENLRFYLEVFGHANIRVMLYDDLVANPEKLTQGLLAFLGVNMLEDLSIRARINVSATSRVPRLTAGARKLAQLARNAGFSGVIGKLKYSALRQLVFTSAASGEIQIDRESFLRMQAAFLPDIAALEEMIGRDLSSWRQAQL